MRFVRWAAVLPGALLGAWLAYMVGGFVNALTTVWATGHPLTGITKLSVDFMNNMYLGAAFVFLTIKIAPSHPRAVATVAAGMVLSLAVVSLALGLIGHRLQFIPGVIGACVGAGAAFLSGIRGEIQPHPLSTS